MIWDDQRFVAFDFEASGTIPEYALQPWRLQSGDFWATSISVICRYPDGLKPWMSELFPTVHYMRQFLEMAIERNWVVIGWNLLYDISILLAYGLRDLVFKVRWLDGLLLWKHLDIDPEYDVTKAKKQSYALKPDAELRFIPFAHHPDLDEVDFHSRDPAELAKLQYRNNRDSVRTWVITKIIWERLTEKQRAAAWMEAGALPLVAEANLRGMPVDTLFGGSLRAMLAATAKQRLADLAPHGLTGPEMVRSPKQLSALMYDVWKLPVLKETTTAKGETNRSTDKEVLYELAIVDGRARLIKEYRESLNNDTKFALAPLTSAEYNGDGNTRPAAIMFGTYTGRMTYASKQGKNKDARQTGFAIHQEKRGGDFRQIICSPPGYSLVEFDAAGQEFRWMAILSGDPNMLQLCMPGEDSHAFMGSRIVGKDYRHVQLEAKVAKSQEEQDRYLGKFANLSCQYRTGPKTLRVRARTDYDIPLELPQAQLIHRTYRTTYTEVPKYWDRAIELCKKQGYAETLAGRRVALVGDWGGSLSWKMESTSLNYPVQGTGGDQKYLAIDALKDLLIPERCYFAWDMHDGLYWWVPDNLVDRIAVAGKKILDNLSYQREWGFTPPIPMPWDCKTGKAWGALEEHKG